MLKPIRVELCINCFVWSVCQLFYFVCLTCKHDLFRHLHFIILLFIILYIYYIIHYYYYIIYMYTILLFITSYYLGCIRSLFIAVFYVPLSLNIIFILDRPYIKHFINYYYNDIMYKSATVILPSICV